MLEFAAAKAELAALHAAAGTAGLGKTLSRAAAAAADMAAPSRVGKMAQRSGKLPAGARKKAPRK
jgi:hypothetical protein